MSLSTCFNRIFRPAVWRQQQTVQGLALLFYCQIVDQARLPIFYESYAVPDSLDGRFDMICLHTALLTSQLRLTHPQMAQAVFDMMFADMDRNLREMGVGDLGVGRRVMAMAEAFQGRLLAYEQALQADDSDLLVSALRRNLYGTVAVDQQPVVTKIQQLARYVMTTWHNLREYDPYGDQHLSDLWGELQNEQG